MLSNYNGREDLEHPELFDKSIYKEISQELVIFNLDEIESLPNRIHKILFHPEMAQCIADNGRQRAMRTDTWQCRADELDRDLLEYMLSI